MGGRGGTATTATSNLTGRGGLSSNPAVRDVQVENRIREAYNDLHKNPGGYVGLADIRDHPSLTRLSRKEVDDALLRGQRKGMVMVTADNTRALKQRDHDAAVDVGGNPRHWIVYQPRGAAPLIGAWPG